MFDRQFNSLLCNVPFLCPSLMHACCYQGDNKRPFHFIIRRVHRHSLVSFHCSSRSYNSSPWWPLLKEHAHCLLSSSSSLCCGCWTFNDSNISATSTENVWDWSAFVKERWRRLLLSSAIQVTSKYGSGSQTEYVHIWLFCICETIGHPRSASGGRGWGGGGGDVEGNLMHFSVDNNI